MRVVSARVSTIVHATEDREKVIHALNEICGLEISPRFTEHRAVKGHYGNPIIPLALSFRGTHADALLVNVWTGFSRQERNRLVEELADLLDDDGRLHFRLDKQEGFRGKARLNDRDPIKVQFFFQRALTHIEVASFLESLSR